MLQMNIIWHFKACRYFVLIILSVCQNFISIIEYNNSKINSKLSNILIIMHISIVLIYFCCCGAISDEDIYVHIKVKTLFFTFCKK